MAAKVTKRVSQRTRPPHKSAARKHASRAKVSKAHSQRARNRVVGKPHHPPSMHLALAIYTLVAGILGLDLVTAGSIPVAFLTTDMVCERWTAFSSLVRICISFSISLNVFQFIALLHYHAR